MLKGRGQVISEFRDLPQIDQKPSTVNNRFTFQHPCSDFEHEFGFLTNKISSSQKIPKIPNISIKVDTTKEFTTSPVREFNEFNLEQSQASIVLLLSTSSVY